MSVTQHIVADHSRRPRIALYSHDTMGLGHMRRNLLLAQTFGSSALQAGSLIIAGAREAAAFTMPPGVDCLTLPALFKDGDGRYESRHMRLALREIVALRAAAIRAAIEAFEPDVFIVDNVPRGAVHELDPTLRFLHGGHTRLVLGLRDILDEAGVVRAEWRHADNEQVIRDHYEAIWVYGDRQVCDPAIEYGFSPDVAACVRFAGYLDQRERFTLAVISADRVLEGLGLPVGRLVLGLVGGGQDGAQLADAFTRTALPPDTNAVLVTGPFMPTALREAFEQRTRAHPRLRVLDFLPEPGILLARADRVVAMGGYSTSCEILSFEKPALIIPRVTPRLEQCIRATRLAALGLVHTLAPSDATPDRIGAWLASDLRPTPAARSVLDFDGLRRVPQMLEQLLQRPAVRVPTLGRSADAHA